MAVFYGEEHSPQSTTSARCRQHHSRQRVESHERPLRLDVMPRNIPPDQPEAGPSRGGPVCQQADKSVAKLCLLEARPNGNGNRCLHTKLDRVQSIRQSSLEYNRESTGTDTQPTSRACVSGTSMKITDMVPCVTGDHIATTPDLFEERPNTSHTPGELTRGNAHTSHVDYLQQKYKDCQRSYKTPPGTMEAKNLQNMRLTFWKVG